MGIDEVGTTAGAEEVGGDGGWTAPLPLANGFLPPQKLWSHEVYPCCSLAPSFALFLHRVLLVTAAVSSAASQATVMHCSMKPEILGEQSISGLPAAPNCEKHWDQHCGRSVGMSCGTEGLPEAEGTASLAKVVPTAARVMAIGANGRMLG